MVLSDVSHTQPELMTPLGIAFRNCRLPKGNSEARAEGTMQPSAQHADPEEPENPKKIAVPFNSMSHTVSESKNMV